MKSHLTAKLFLITSGMLLAVAAVTYGFILRYAPERYLIAVEQTISREAQVIMGEMSQANADEAQKLLDQFNAGYRVSVSLKNGEEDGEAVEREPVKADPPAGPEDYEVRTREPDAMYEFQFSDSPDTYTLTIGGKGQTLGPFTTALNQVLLPLTAVVFILAFIVSLFYSRYITRPVIEISQASKKLASLDFNVSCKEGRADELGELAGSLNQLSHRLSSALGELNRANALLREDVEREKEREGRQLAFFSAVSHELKTPITILKGQLQGMIYHVGGYKDRDKYLKRSFEVTCAMENLVKEILSVSRMKSSGFSLKMEEILLTEFVMEILEDYEDLLHEKGMKVTVETDHKDQVTVLADKGLFAKVITNLISNGYQYSPSGGELRIRITGGEQGARLSLENTGVHIPEEEIPVLFQAFTRREQSRSRETGGSGLGLFIIHMALDLCHFSYSMENTEEGVRFSIVFNS